ncbi:MAG: ABC transporter permease [Bacteroidetes bacterium]|nr:MAG: ABC transporter permease [Bacteroidota bacterium]
MDFEYFIAKKISSGKTDNLSKPVIRISYISIALGLALMIISVAIVVGFKKSISDKIIGFAAHMQIVPFDNNTSLEEQPLTIDGAFINRLAAHPEISHIQFTAKKAGVLKTDEQIQGVVVKGVGADYDQNFLKENIIEGSFPNVSSKKKTNEVLISATLSTKLKVKVGDELRVWFISGEQSQPRGRKFEVSGIFKTSLEEFDGRFIIADIRHLKKLNNWTEEQVGSVEVFIRNPDKLDEVADNLYQEIPYDLNIITVTDEYPQIFNWLDLLDMNVAVVLVLMILVAGITMVSTLLIIILERTNMVGVLKSLGANNTSIRKVFLLKAAVIISKGMFWGNIAGLGFYFIQKYFQLIKLSPENYYMDFVPVELSLVNFLLLNLGTFIICLLMLIVPSYYISRIVPAKALRYE